jgi:HEAT repeat protein
VTDRRGLVNLTPPERARIDDIETLARAGSGSMAALVERLDDPSWAVRRVAVSALSRAGDIALIPLRDILLHRRDNEARIAAACDALVASQGDADACALAVIQSGASSAVLCDMASILGRRRSTGAVAVLADLASHADDNVAMAALEALGRIGGDVAVEMLIAAVLSKNFFRSFPAIDVLGRSASPRAVEPLASLLNEPHYAVEATRALGRTGQQAAVRPLVSQLGRSNDALVRTTAVALAEIHDRHFDRFGSAASVLDVLREGDGPAADRRIVQCLGSADPSEQRAMCRVLGWLGSEGATFGLIELLDGEAATAAAAVDALATLGRLATPQLREALRYSDSQRRALLLPLIGAKSAAKEDVFDCLGDTSPTVRALACDTLARIGDVSVVPRLFDLLADEDARVSHAAAAAIQSLGSAQTETLALEAARSTDMRVRRSALRIVSYFGYPAATDLMIDAIGDDDERTRDVATTGLASLDDPRATQALVTAAAHSSPRTRAAAVRALGQMVSTKPTDPARVKLREALADVAPWVRYYACQGLGRTQDVASADSIVLLLDDPAGQVRVAAIDALARLRGERALDALHRAAGSADQDVARAALLGLGVVKSPTSMATLEKATRSEDSATRLVALSAISEFATTEASQLLSAAISDADDGVRSAAINLLASRAGAQATQALIDNLQNPVVEARIVAALSQPVDARVGRIHEALRMATAETGPLLVSALARMHRADAEAALLDAFTFDNVFTRRAAGAALGALRMDTARPLLEAAAANDPDREVRHVCLAALSP